MDRRSDSGKLRRMPFFHLSRAGRRNALVAIGGLLLAGYFAAWAVGWHAKLGWQRAKADLLASGSLLTFEQSIPPTVPEAENFAAIPLLRPLWEDLGRDRVAGGPGEDSKVDPLAGLDLEPADERSTHYRFHAWQPDLGATVASLRTGPIPPGEAPARTILRLLAAHDARLTAFSEGVRRPASRFPLRYDHGLSMVRLNVVPFRHVALLYVLRATARLELGEAAAAAEDLVTLLRLGRHFQRERLPGVFQMGAYFAGTVAAPLRFGCQRRAWTADVLAVLERELEGWDIVAGFWRMQQADLSRFVLAAEADFARAADQAGLWTRLCSPLAALFFRTLEDFARGRAETLSRLPHSLSELGMLQAYLCHEEQLEESVAPWYGQLGHPGLPAGPRSFHRMVAAQARVELCLAAVRLERERLQAGRYPATTAGLHLPNDPLAGGPLGYGVAPDGARFRLAGVGWQVEPRGRDYHPLTDPWIRVSETAAADLP